MDLQQLTYFVAVAEELHFGRAALKLHIAEQPLGYQIRRLEEELGFRLFDRTTRSVALTPAGAAFLEDARKLLAHADRATDSARRIAAGEAGVLRLGYEVSAVPSIMPDFVRLFRAEYPEIDLVLIEHSKGGVTSLLEGETDACLVTRFERLPKTIAYTPVLEDRAVIALQASHPLAETASVRLSDLEGIRFLGYSGTESDPANRFMAALASHSGMDAQIAEETESFLGLLGLVAAGLGFTIVTGCMASLLPAQIAYLPLVDPEVPVDYGLAIRAGETAPLLSSAQTVAKHLKALVS